MDLSDVTVGGLFSPYKPFDAEDWTAKVCRVVSVQKWRGVNWVHFTRSPSLSDRGTTATEKTDVRSIYAISPEEYQRWLTVQEEMKKRLLSCEVVAVDTWKERDAARKLERAHLTHQQHDQVITAWFGSQESQQAA